MELNTKAARRAGRFIDMRLKGNRFEGKYREGRRKLYKTKPYENSLQSSYYDKSPRSAANQGLTHFCSEEPSRSSEAQRK
jgi:hypothetical protein